MQTPLTKEQIQKICAVGVWGKPSVFISSHVLAALYVNPLMLSDFQTQMVIPHLDKGNQDSWERLFHRSRDNTVFFHKKFFPSFWIS